MHINMYLKEVLVRATDLNINIPLGAPQEGPVDIVWTGTGSTFHLADLTNENRSNHSNKSKGKSRLSFKKGDFLAEGTSNNIS